MELTVGFLDEESDIPSIQDIRTIISIHEPYLRSLYIGARVLMASEDGTLLVKWPNDVFRQLLEPLFHVIKSVDENSHQLTLLVDIPTLQRRAQRLLERSIRDDNDERDMYSYYNNYIKSKK
jgi:hypothetical protein